MDNQQVTTLNFDGAIKKADRDPLREDAFLSANLQNHASNLLPLTNGDLLCTWFAGTQEGMADIHIYLSRLNKGETVWSGPVRLSDDAGRSEQNPVLFQTPKGDLWLLYTAQKSGNQDTAIVRYCISEDNGYTWGPIETLFDTPGTFIRQPVTVLENGDWLLPVFYCETLPGEKWTGNYDRSAVKISTDQGRSWEEVEVPDRLGCVHMNINVLANGSLLALFRSRWADHIYESRSVDNGRTWSRPEPTSLPNNNSSIQFTVINNGHLALVYNAMSADNCTERRTSLYDEIEDDEDTNKNMQKECTSQPAAGRSAFWGAPRAPMTIALSFDNGKTWPVTRNLETGDGYAMTNNSKDKLNREYSYPSIKQSTDGTIHIAYTYFRQAIKYVRITEEWVK